MRTTEYPDAWNFLEKMLLEKDSDTKAAHYVSQGQSSFSGFALAEETCGRGRLWLIPP